MIIAFCRNCDNPFTLICLAKYHGICACCRNKLKRFHIEENFNNLSSSKDIIPIDLELIKSLRAVGRHKDAELLLVAFRQSVEKEKKGVVNEILRDDRKIKKFYGICEVSSCKKMVMEGNTYCKECLNNRRLYYHKNSVIYRVQAFFKNFMG